MTRSELATSYFKEGYNCSQAVALAFKDMIGLDEKVILKVASSFGGGMGRLREVCGACTGMFIVVGFVEGYDDPKDREAKTKHYATIQRLAQEFKKYNGSIVCRELLGLGKGPDSPVPDARTSEYYKKRPCAEMVGLAAGILEQYFNGELE